MKTARQLIERKPGVVSIAPHESVFTALERMAEHDIGALVVLDGPVLAGVLSERDYARKVILLGKSSRDMRVSEIMTHKVVCVGPDQTVDQCMAVMTEKRTALLPNVPSVAELGYRGVDSSIRFALFVPAATPADVVAKLAAANTRALADASLREAFQKAGYDIVSATGPQVAAMVQREYAVWGPIVRDLGLQPE
jgi:hypothetical protein